MIHEEIVTFEVAKLAKVKGFPQDVFGTCEMKSACYLDDGRFCKDGCIYPIEDAYTAPTQSLLQRWLREEKGIIIDVVLDWSYNIDFEEIRYQYRIGSIDRMTIEGGNKTKGLVFDKRFTTYELALEDALAYSLKNLV